MHASLKKILKAVTLELRHLLEGRYDADGNWKPGDLEQRLAAIGVRRNKVSAPVDELGHLSDEDKHARKVVDAYIQLREDAGVKRADAIADFERETAYTWANRLLALRCMEARELIDEVILQKEVYGNRSLEHHRLVQRQPELCSGEDDGLIAVLDNAFREQARRLPMLFDPHSAGVALRPSAAKLRTCIEMLSLQPAALRKAGVRIGELDDDASAGADTGDAPDISDVFRAPDALGWAYQYWNTEEKDRVFEKVRTQKGAKIAGADIIPATQLYTESYMVQFLVQNSLGATWMGMHPDSRLFEEWDYYVRDADRAPVQRKPVQELTFLDPACGSGHFLLEAFDLLYAMYEEEGELTDPESICDAILTQNLYGIDIDARAVQIAEAALWMKAAERAFDYEGVPTNLVAAVSSHLQGPHWEEFLDTFTNEPSIARVLRKFGESMEHIDELGSLARPNEDLQKIIAEEHAIWEKQVREQKEANFLFAEMREDALDGKLAFSEISDEEFGEKLFYRVRAAIDAFTEQARERGEFQDQFLGEEATTGFKLLEILRTRFDAVCTNPPYAGSRTLGRHICVHLDNHYPPGKRDLYAAFILRCRDLTLASGRFSLITQQSWMFLQSFADLRYVDPQTSRLPEERFSGLLLESSIETLAQLGRHAFSEADPPNNVVLVSCSKTLPADDHRLHCFRLSASRPAEVQASLLAQGVSGNIPSIVFRPHQDDFRRIPLAPLVYAANDTLIRVLSSPTRLGVKAAVRQGLATSDNARYLRYYWETSASNTRWEPYLKGGKYQKWTGLDSLVIDWRCDGAGVKAKAAELYGSVTRTIKNQDFYFLPCLTYTLMARGSLGVRRASPSVFDVGGMCIFLEEKELDAFAALLNSRIVSYLLRIVSQDLKFQCGTVELLPLPSDFELDSTWASVGRHAIELKRKVTSETDITDRAFDEGLFGVLAYSRYLELQANEMRTSAALHTLETLCEIKTANYYDLSPADMSVIFEEVGSPVGQLPLIDGHEANCIEEPGLVAEIEQAIADVDRINATPEKLKGFIAQIRSAFEDGSDSDNDQDLDASSGEPSYEEPSVGNAYIRAETFLEEVSNQVGLHPMSVAKILDDGIRQHRWRSRSRQRSFATTCLSAIVLRLLGHRWSTSSDSSIIPDDSDGIIPLIDNLDEPSLIARIQKFAAQSENSEAWGEVFEAMVGQSSYVWLTTELFPHHCSQFKKRPIAWQFQSGAFTSRHCPAYACLAYYHKLDSDLIRKVRKQAEDVRKSVETELRGIASKPEDARSNRQEQRRILLEDQTAELKRFDTALAQLVQSGFGPEALIAALRQYAVDDATLALKSRWLKRLSSFLADTTLAQWQAAASDAQLHDDLPEWIAQAVMQLNHHCATVGIKAPKLKDVGDEPTAADLARLICQLAKEMAADALKHACDVWWKQLDEIVLAPLNDEVKQMKNERKDIKAELALEPPPDADEVRRLKLRDRDLREDIKLLQKKISRLKGRAAGLRTLIQEWTSDEPLTWEPWLSEQPLFDEVSSLDGRKAPPKTIAEFVAQESAYVPDINDGVRVNIAPLQMAGILAADALPKKDVEKAIADRAEWRSDERRWVREGKLPTCGWWASEEIQPTVVLPDISREPFEKPGQYAVFAILAMLVDAGGESDLRRLARAYILLSRPQMIVENAPRLIRDVVARWRSVYPESPSLEFFRDALLDLVARDLIDPTALRDGRVRLVDDSQSASEIEMWVVADAKIALAVVDAMPPNAVRDLITEEEVGGIKLSIAG